MPQLICAMGFISSARRAHQTHQKRFGVLWRLPCRVRGSPGLGQCDAIRASVTGGDLGPANDRRLRSIQVTSEYAPVAGFGFPGPLRDALMSAILAGKKTATSSLLVEYERDGEPAPKSVIERP